ncbi:MAG TPA: Fic family protein [Chloroflexota bacterium]|nr:Fic family protein [Chloroflexota bacterium]
MDALDPTSPAGQFLLRFVQESNAIEDVSIADQVLIAGWQERRGHMGALRQMLELASGREPLTIQHLCAWQALITREQLPYGHWIADEHIGCIRTQRMRRGRREFADPADIRRQLDEILDEVNTPGGDAVAMAARAHWRFELVHPFADGNGRTGRLVVLYALRSAGVPPVLFTFGDRDSRYFRAFDLTGPERMGAYFAEHQLERDPLA